MWPNPQFPLRSFGRVLSCKANFTSHILWYLNLQKCSWNLSSMCNKYEMWGKWSCGQDFFKRYLDLAFFFIVLLTFFFTDGLKVFCFALLEHFNRRLVMRTKPMYKYFEKVAWNAFSWEKPCIDFISRKYFDFKILKLIKNM